uniref:Electron transfer flavoprotein regulatory factor 1 n=1 Tax=Xenopus tropicalis TaxID=8364 RepID=A0A803J9T2_XENTR
METTGRERGGAWCDVIQTRRLLPEVVRAAHVGGRGCAQPLMTMANPLRGEVVRLYKNVSNTVIGYQGIMALLAVTVGIWGNGNDLLLFVSPLKLLFLGREYPKGESYFRERLKRAFLKNKDVRDPEKIKELIGRGEFVIKELEALYFLRKYRAMKQRYYEDKESP